MKRNNFKVLCRSAEEHVKMMMECYMHDFLTDYGKPYLFESDEADEDDYTIYIGNKGISGDLKEYTLISMDLADSHGYEFIEVTLKDSDGNLTTDNIEHLSIEEVKVIFDDIDWNTLK